MENTFTFFSVTLFLLTFLLYIAVLAFGIICILVTEDYSGKKKTFFLVLGIILILIGLFSLPLAEDVFKTLKQFYLNIK